MNDIDRTQRMGTPRGVAPTGCPVRGHFGFPLPCVQCARVSGRIEARAVKPARTTAATRAGRIARIAEAAERARTHHTIEAPPPAQKAEATMARGKATEVTFKKRKQTTPEWAAELKMSTIAVAKRVKNGVPLDAPKTPGAPSLAGTWDYGADKPTGKAPTPRTVAKPIAHRDVKPAKAAPKTPPRTTRATAPDTLTFTVTRHPVDEDQLAAALRPLGYELRRTQILEHPVLLLERRPWTGQ